MDTAKYKRDKIFLVYKVGETLCSTLSILQDTDSNRNICWIIEDGYREQKVKGETRIPHGRYRVIKRTHGRIAAKMRKRFGYKYIFELEGVPNFTDILIHPGNFIKDTEGCLLPNTSAAWDNDKDQSFRGSFSVAAYKRLHAHINEAIRRYENVFIDIDRNQWLIS